jgi:hypothetical protein
VNLLELVRADGHEMKRVGATNGGEYAGPVPSAGAMTVSAFGLNTRRAVLVQGVSQDRGRHSIPSRFAGAFVS